MQLGRLPTQRNAIRTARTSIFNLSASRRQSPPVTALQPSPAVSAMAINPAADVPHAEAAWEWFNRMGAPKYWVAPMVDQSELAFRMLCRHHGAHAAYTPMLHARLCLETPSYRAEHFTTCDADRPVLAQFCANDPDILLAAAQLLAPHIDGVDLNLGCPQRIAQRGRYGAFLMDDIPLVESMVRNLATNLDVPVTVKIRRFDDIEQTVEYAARLERAGASLVAVHGRTRAQKKSRGCLADWDAIAAVKRALRVPVLANGNIRSLVDVAACLEATGADGVLSAEPLLEDPALFSDRRLTPGGAFSHLDGPRLLLEYLDLCDLYPAPFRMIKGHAFKLLGPWLSEHVDLRERLNRGEGLEPTAGGVRELTQELLRRVEASGREYPVPALNPRKLAAMEAQAALEAAIAEQQREEEGLRALGGVDKAAAGQEGGCWECSGAEAAVAVAVAQ